MDTTHLNMCEKETLVSMIVDLHKEVDIEHIRYLDEQEKWSNKLCEICEYLEIDNDDTSGSIIKEIEKLKAQNVLLRKDSDALNKILSDYDCDDTDELCEQIEDWKHTHERFEEGDIMERDIFLEQLEEEGKAIYTEDDIKLLQEENEKLKAEFDEQSELLDDARAEASCHKEQNDILYGENEELKTSNEHRRKQNDENYCKVEMMESKVSSFDEMKSECIALRKENESLTHTVKEQSRILNLTSGHFLNNEQDKAIFDDMITQAKLDKRFRPR